MSVLSRSTLLRVLSLVAATVVAGVGVFLVGMSTITDVQRAHAEFVATAFADHLVEEVPDLRSLIEGQRPADVTAAVIGAVRPIGSITHFRVFDQNGVLRADSAMAPDGVGVSAGSLSDRSPVAAEVLATSRTSFGLREGDGVERPRYYSDITIPLMEGERTIGVLSIISDETKTWPGLFAVPQRAPAGGRAGRRRLRSAAAHVRPEARPMLKAASRLRSPHSTTS